MSILINKVYTRGGDGGQTSLVGGQRVDQDCLKLETYGTVDELICLVGTACTSIEISKFVAETNSAEPNSTQMKLIQALRKIQNKLFDMGSILATPAGETYPSMPQILDEDSAVLEEEMDQMQIDLEPLKSFVLPGGNFPNAYLHQCRAVCRRAEREILRLSREEAVDARLLKYINRLSDYFFVMARYVSAKSGVKEYLWEYGSIKNSN